MTASGRLFHTWAAATGKARDKVAVTTDHYEEVIYGLSNKGNSNDLEWPSRWFTYCLFKSDFSYRCATVDKIWTDVVRRAVPLQQRWASCNDFAFIVQFKHKHTKFLALFNICFFYGWPFLHVCILMHRVARPMADVAFPTRVLHEKYGSFSRMSPAARWANAG